MSRKSPLFCCGSIRRKKGADLEIAGQKVGLTRDTNFRLFLNQISARRLRRPDGRECYDQCQFYRVTATLTGLFAQTKENSGYGHFGMFHLLVIQRVEKVSAERTQVPFGGVFQCPEENWAPGPELVHSVAESLNCANLAERDCGPEQRFNLVAAHWNDAVSRGFQTDVYSDTNGDQIANWVSSDLLTSYFTRTKDESVVSITRGHCTASSHGRAPDTSSIECEEHRQHLDEATDREVERSLAKNDFAKAWAKEAEGAQHLYSAGDQTWRGLEPKFAAWHVLLEQVKDWKISPDPALQFAECADASTEESPSFVSCSWYSLDGTQAFRVALFKNRVRDPEQPQGLWLVTGVEADVCRAVTE